MSRFPHGKKMGLHAFRSGGASAAAAAGVSLREIKLHGRWKSDAVYAYIKDSLKDRQAITKRLGI